MWLLDSFIPLQWPVNSDRDTVMIMFTVLSLVSDATLRILWHQAITTTHSHSFFHSFIFGSTLYTGIGPAFPMLNKHSIPGMFPIAHVKSRRPVVHSRDGTHALHMLGKCSITQLYSSPSNSCCLMGTCWSRSPLSLWHKHTESQHSTCVPRMPSSWRSGESNSRVTYAA